MITMDMTNKRQIHVADRHFSVENGILTLQVNLGSYDLTGKTIPAGYRPTEVKLFPVCISNNATVFYRADATTAIKLYATGTFDLVNILYKAEA